MSEIIKNISEQIGETEEKIWELIEAKRKEMEYLISEEGAAHIVASELGVGVTKKNSVKSLKDGQDNVNITLKLDRVSDAREWKKGGRKGKVRNIVASDETGELRISLWNEKAEVDLKEGAIIKILGGSTKERDGQLELRVGSKSNLIINPEIRGRRNGMAFEASETARNARFLSAKIGSSHTIKVAMVRASQREPFFNSPDGEQLMVSGILDDGESQIRGVMFREVAEKFIGIKTADAIKIADTQGYGQVLAKIPMGKDFWFVGRIKHNEITDTKEMIVNKIYKVDAGEEVETKIRKMMGL
ncbi:MAG: hypothetical protein GOV00_02020 [Candidatus Altiarchaeota archaeon]|nr:hypothetical protein [Candidatus Altiarchaeota archaeon]